MRGPGRGDRSARRTACSGRRPRQRSGRHSRRSRNPAVARATSPLAPATSTSAPRIRSIAGGQRRRGLPSASAGLRRRRSGTAAGARAKPPPCRAGSERPSRPASRSIWRQPPPRGAGPAPGPRQAACACRRRPTRRSSADARPIGRRPQQPADRVRAAARAASRAEPPRRWGRRRRPAARPGPPAARTARLRSRGCPGRPGSRTRAGRRTCRRGTGRTSGGRTRGRIAARAGCVYQSPSGWSPSPSPSERWTEPPPAAVVRHGVGGRGLDPAAGLGVAVVVDDQRALVAAPVGVGEDVLVDPAVRRRRSRRAGSARPRRRGGGGGAAGRSRARGARPGRSSGCLVPVGAAVLHAVLLGEALDLAVAEHRQARQRGHQRADAEVLVALAELLDRGPLVRVVHEVDEALEDLRVELERVLDDACGTWRSPRRAACS